MVFLGFANALAVVASCWAVWVRRVSLGSRWDAPLTIGVALYGVASALDAPWPAIASASFPLTGKYYLLNTVGHICFLAGNAAGLRAVFIRLLPDHEIGRFVQTRIAPVVTIAATVMLVCVIASPMTSTMPANYLYGIPLDGWLRVYFCVFFLTMTATLWMAFFGGIRLAEEPRSPGTVLPLLGTASTGSLACLSFLVVILTGRTELIPRLWPIGFLATAAAAVACAVAWRHRIADLTVPVDEP
jgi:hypothetical protein